MTRTRLGDARGLRGAPGGGSRGAFHRLAGAGKYSRGTVLSGWSAIGVTIAVVASALFGYAKFRDVLDGINHIVVSDLGKRPPKFSNAMNVLLIGSDTRSGHNRKLGGFAEGQRSDTVMVVHISPGHSHIYVLSFPRDSVVPIYQCSAEPGFPGQTAQEGVEQINSSFAYGGPGCLWKTIEHTTQIRIDDFVELNFTGFVNIINALGGVEVCVPAAITPTQYDHLKMSPGKHFIYGYRALEFWRLREGFGLGSDLQRIQRDQLLMVALVQRILKTGVLHSVRKTYGIIQAIVKAHALTTDAGLTPQKILQIGTSMSGISRKSIQFIEVPTATYPGNSNWVEFDPEQTPKLFSAVAHDVKLPKIHKGKKGSGAKGSGSGQKATETSKNKGQSKGSGGTGKSAPKLLATSDVSVEVLNGSGVEGIAGTTSTALTARGFHVLGASAALTATGATDFSYVQSVVQYGSPADLAAARTVAAQLTNVKLQLNPSLPVNTVNLVLGSDFKALAPPVSQPPGNLAKQYSGYTGTTNVCKGYGSAFVGS
ncbi:MAG TPA: LCP family protein [Streptosporangiaceae bacterium]|nr:LCP family protein [Streptosporangiaceae bacterium]